jgi:peptide/nickel transport system permease protein
MQRYIIVRGFHAVIALFAVSIIIFGLTHASGDPTDIMLPEEATQEDVARAREFWGLDKPLHVQYITYLGNIFTGNFGESIKWRGKSTRDLLLQRLPATVQLSAFAFLVSIALSIPIGILSAVKKDTVWDYGGKFIALLGQSLPSFWIGIVLIWIFAVHLDLFPTSGQGGIRHMVLPSIALGWFSVASGMRLSRSAMLDVLDSEYVKLARIKGLPEWKVIWKHCLRNAALVPITFFGVQLAGLITGSVVIETVFAWPGVGLLSIEAIRARDFQVVQSVVVVFAFI